MSLVEAKLTDAGIDYLRVTTQDERQRGRLIDFYRAIRDQDKLLGYEEVTGGAFGFVGKKTRHALMGDKKEWSMLQVSGRAAKRGIFLAEEGTQASRIDLQLTYFVGEENVESTIRGAYNSACMAGPGDHRPVRVNLIESRHKAQTVYIGSRASDVFFRIYDKYAESQKDEYRGCVRYELELKGRKSKQLWQRWVQGTSGLRSGLEMVVAMFQARGVVVPSQDLDNQDIIRLTTEKTSEEDTLAWLRRSVAPTVKRLCGSYGWITPFRILFEDALPDFRTHRIMRLLSVVWGS